MDKDEVADWIFPADYDHVSSEVKHLISESDVDHVSILFKNNTKKIWNYIKLLI